MNAGLLLQVIDHRARAAPPGQRGGQRGLVLGRQQIERDVGVAAGGDLVAQQRAGGIDQIALQPAGAQHRFAEAVEDLAGAVGELQAHVLQRRAGMALAQEVAPGDVEAAVGRHQRRHVDALPGQPRLPGAVRAQPRPARAAQRQHDCIVRARPRPLRRVEAERPATALRGLELSGPAVARMQHQPGRAQPVQPGAQQRRGLHALGKDLAGAADEGRDALRVHPGAQRLGAEAVEPRADLGGALAVATAEGRLRLGMGDVEPALAGKQELAPDRGHGIEELDLRAGSEQDIGGHQAGGTAADDGDAERKWGRHAASLGARRRRARRKCDQIAISCRTPSASMSLPRPRWMISPRSITRYWSASSAAKS